MLSLTLFGGFWIKLSSGAAISLPTQRAQALLAYLALHPGQAQSRTKLATLLWGDTFDTRARQSLRQALSGLRKGLARVQPELLQTKGEGIRLNPDAVDVDVVTFGRLVATKDPEALAQAAALYQGDLLAGLDVKAEPFEEWLLGERERLRELTIEALARLLGYQRQQGMLEAAVQTALRLLGLDPLQEVIHRTLMHLYTQQGRRDAALRQYQICVEVLQRELTVEPEADTKQLYQEILRQRLEHTMPIAPVLPAETSVLPAAAGPFIGRKPEMAGLQATLDKTQRGHGQVVVIRGEAGIGKSRLVEELAADALQRGNTVFVGRSYPSEQILPFGSWVDALRTGRVVSDSALLESLSPVVRSELGHLLPELGEPESSQVMEPEDYTKLFEALVQLVSRLVSRQPVLWILEDLHWADEMSLRFFAFLSRRVRSWPLLIVGTIREEELAAAPFLQQVLQELDREHRLVQLNVPPLARSDTLALVRALARAGSRKSTLARLEERVWAMSEGNPFVVTETLHELQAGRVSQRTTKLALPQRVREVIVGHLDQLSARSREIAGVAAVIGREFDFRLLQSATGLHEQEAAEGMEELVRRRTFHHIGEQFDFAHDQLREVAYERLLPFRRQALHAEVGRALETLHDGGLEAVYDRLAYHYAKTDDCEKAVTYLVCFSQLAARRYAFQEAAQALQDALGHAERLPPHERDSRLLDVALRLAGALFPLGRFAEILDLLRRYEPHVQRLGNPRLAGHYYLMLGNTSIFVEDHNGAIQYARRALEEAAQGADQKTMGKAHYMLAVGCSWSGNALEGIEHGRQAVAFLEQYGLDPWLGLAHFGLAANYFILGKLSLALDSAAKLRALADATGDSRVAPLAAWTTSFLLAHAGESEAGVQEGRRAVALARDPFNTACALGCLGCAYLAKGDADEAVRTLTKAIRLCSRLGIRQWERWFSVFLCEAHLLKGDLEKARNLAVRKLDLTTGANYRYRMGLAQRTLGRVALAGGALSEAQTHLSQALRAFAAVEARLELGRTHLAFAELAYAQKNSEATAVYLNEAREVFQTLELPRWVERTEQLASSFVPQ